jgi:hypothetical protein
MPPKVLILHFKRFDSLKQLKISSHVDLPIRGLDLSPFVQQQYRQQLERNHLFSPTGSGVPLSRSSSGVSNCRSSSNGNDISEEQGSGLDSHLLYDLQGLVSHKGSLTQVEKQGMFFILSHLNFISISYIFCILWYLMMITYVTKLCYQINNIHRFSLQGHYISYVAAMNGTAPSDNEPATWLR